MAQVEHTPQRCLAEPTDCTMPGKWPNELYDYGESKVVHEDIESLDLEEGKRFKCKCCILLMPNDRLLVTNASIAGVQ